MDYVFSVWGSTMDEGLRTISFNQPAIDIMREIHYEFTRYMKHMLSPKYLVLNQEAYEAFTWYANRQGVRGIPNEFEQCQIVLEMANISLVQIRLSAHDEYLYASLLQRIRSNEA